MERISLINKKIILLLSGFNLMIIQFMMIRTFSSILLGTEVILLIVTISYFAGHSLGYYASDKISIEAFEILSALMMAVHFTFPFSARYACGYLFYYDSNFFALAMLIFSGAFLLSSFYSMILPRFIDQEGNESMSLMYRIELAGAILGVLFLFGAGRFSLGSGMIMTVYLSAMAVIFQLLWGSKVIVAVTLLLIVGYSAGYAQFERWSVAYFYDSTKSKGSVEYVFSADTPYQRVEVIEGEFGMRHLYLDGVRHFGGESLGDFNYYIAELSASLMQSPSVLIVGSGSLGSMLQVLPKAKSVDTVEIDKTVIEAGRKFLGGKPDPQTEKLLEEKWTLNIDDAKHFLKNSGRKYDLIAMDIAGPIQMQVALLYTEEFYKIAAEKLSDRGMICVSLNGQVEREGTTASRILKTLSGVFRELYVIAPYNDSNFAIAGQSIPFKKEDLEKKIRSMKLFKTKVLGPQEVQALLAQNEWRKISLSRMDIVLKRGWTRLITHYFGWEE